MEDHSATQSTSNYYKAKDYVRTSPLVDQDPKINFKVDVHTHILPSPDKLPDLKEKYGYGGFLSMEYHDHTKCKAKMLIDGKLMREVEHNCYSPEQRIIECDKTNVSVQVLSTVPVMFSYWAKPEHCLDLSRYLNDHISNIVGENPKRFLGLGTVPCQAPDLAVKELRRCVNELGLSGIQIGSHVQDWNLDREELFPIFEEAERLGAAIFIHPWDMMNSKKMEKYWLPWLVGMPAETTLAACSLMFGGVLDKLPNLKICLAHGGGSLPGTIGRIERGWTCRPDLVQIDTKTNPREMCQRFWVDSLVHDDVMLNRCVDLFGEDKIVLGTDYPFPLGEYGDILPGHIVEQADVSPKLKRKIFCDNALKWLGVNENRFAPEQEEEDHSN